MPRPAMPPPSAVTPPASRPGASRVRTISRAPSSPPPEAASPTAPSRATARPGHRSEEHTSELQSLMRISYAVFCLKKKKKNNKHTPLKQYQNNTSIYYIHDIH